MLKAVPLIALTVTAATLKSSFSIFVAAVSDVADAQDALKPMPDPS